MIKNTKYDITPLSAFFVIRHQHIVTEKKTNNDQSYIISCWSGQLVRDFCSISGEPIVYVLKMNLHTHIYIEKLKNIDIMTLLRLRRNDEFSNFQTHTIIILLHQVLQNVGTNLYY